MCTERICCRYKSQENTLESCSSHLTALKYSVMGKMRTKITFALTVLLALSHRLRAGTIPLGEELLHRQHETSEEAVLDQQQGALASSYVQFHGPVEGPVFEVKVPYAMHHDDGNRLHGDYTLDYVAHPKYEFSYGVEDQHTGDFHAQRESRDGSTVSGQYSVKEPGGSVRIVTYRADNDGFHAVVHTSGKNDHSGGIHPGQGQAGLHDHRVMPQQDQQSHEYASSYTENNGY